MATSYQVYENVTSVTLGSVTLYGVQSITVVQTAAEIHASGDADTYEGVARGGTVSTRVTITTVDPVDADSWHGLYGTLGATYTDAKGSTNKTLAIVGCTVVAVNQGVTRDAPSNGSVELIAESADGTTDPVDIS